MAATDLETMRHGLTPEGKISAPVSGGVPVADFYRHLVADTASATVHLHTIYETQDKLAAPFTYHWELKSGPRTTTDLVDIFDFAPNTTQITHLQIIFDTAKIGKA